MSIFSNIFANFTNQIAAAVADRVLTESGRTIAQARAYRLGNQSRVLKRTKDGYDDNLILNFTGLIVDRLVSQLIGRGIGWDFEGEDLTPQEEYCDAVWNANKQEILLHRAALAASEAGTGYIMINDPSLGMGGAVGRDGIVYPRLVLLDPAFVTMDTMPEDFEVIQRYIIQYVFMDENGKETARRKTVQLIEDNVWEIIDELNQGGRWTLVNRMAWPYPSCPIVHWQNLPTIDSPYGDPDITGSLIEVQNKINADISFLSKSLRLGIDPQRWSRGSQPPARLETDKLVHLGLDGEMGQLPPTTDWQGALAYLKQITQDMFKIARVVDVESMEDRLGSMTNFALRVIYQDNITKINTKRELFGDALEEINRRLILMAGMDEIECEVVWPDWMPVNEVENMQYWQSLQALGVISKQTLADKLGLDWEMEQERINAEKQASDNLGAFLLREFNQGGQAQMPTLIGEGPR